MFPYKSEVWGQMNQTNNVHAMCGEGAAEEGKKQNLLRNTKAPIYDLFYQNVVKSQLNEILKNDCWKQAK